VACFTIRKLAEHVKAMDWEEPRAQSLAQAIRRHIEPFGVSELASPRGSQFDVA